MPFSAMRSFFTPEDEMAVDGPVASKTEDTDPEWEKAIAEAEKKAKSIPSYTPEQWAYMAQAPGGTDIVTPEVAAAWAAKNKVTSPSLNQGKAPSIATPPAPLATEQNKKDEYDLSESEIRDEASAFGVTPEEMRTWLDNQRKMAAASAATSVQRDIPVSAASSTKNAPAPVVSTQPPVTSASPAGPADSAGTRGLPPPSTEGAGGDTYERDLYLARLGAQTAAGFGSMGAGRNIDMGIADTLGERLKQVQALRAKREERTEGIEQEKANNRAQVDYLISRFPDRKDSLVKLYDVTGKPNFPQLVRLEEQLALDDVRTRKAAAEVPLVEARTEAARQAPGFKEREVAVKEQAQKTKDEIAKAQLALRSTQVEHMRARKAAASAPASVTGPLSDPKLEQRRQDTFGKVTRGAQILYTNPLLSTATLEKEASALLKGKTPDWWTPVNLTKINSGVYVGLPPEAVKFAKNYFPVVNQLRHALYGSALTEGEQKAFSQQIELGLLTGPRALAESIRALAERSKVQTRVQLGYDFDRNPDLAAQWLRASGFNDKVKGTSLEDTFAQYVQPASTGGRSAKPADKPGTKTLWNKKTGQWVRYTPDQEAKARAAGAVEE